MIKAIFQAGFTTGTLTSVELINNGDIETVS